MPSMTGPQYEKKVLEFLEGHEDHPVIVRLRQGQPLTSADLAELDPSTFSLGS